MVESKINKNSRGNNRQDASLWYYLIFKQHDYFEKACSDLAYNIIKSLVLQEGPLWPRFS